VDRIGHGTRAIEDPHLVDYLAEKQIPIELCVLSNVRTSVVPDVGSHPARTYYERGIPLSINTDDPKMFGNSLAEEYLALHQQLGFSRMDICRLIARAIDTSWLSEQRKRDLLAQFQSEMTASMPTTAGPNRHSGTKSDAQDVSTESFDLRINRIQHK
jgi:adenosine deaminase